MLNFGIWKSKTFPSLAESDANIVRLDAKGTVQDKSPSAGKLIAAIEQFPEHFHPLLLKAKQARSPVEERIAMAGHANFWVVAMAADEGFYLTALDTTLRDRMADALIKSRTMLKGLLDSAADLSFELDSQGRFCFLSANEAYGLDTEVWMGRCASELFWPRGDKPARNPLGATKSSTYPKVLVSGLKKGAWFSFSVEPVFAEKDQQTGVRGTCCDVSQQIVQENQTKQDKLRLGLSRRIIQQLNASESPDDILKNASSELADVLRADKVWSLVKTTEGFDIVSTGENAPLPFCHEKAWQQLLTSPTNVLEIPEGERAYLTVLLEQNVRKIGMLVISRDTALVPWVSNEKSLLEDVTGALASAFGKAELINKLTELSTRDELTGLLNRRAFVEGVERRLREQRRSGRSGCVLFIDLDNFKAVNDSLGHAVGDKVLQIFALKLQALVRETDYAGRLGGDEFVLWLEGISAEQAHDKATVLLSAMKEVSTTVGAINTGLGVSIGVCASASGQDLSFEDMAERADKALYEVKRSGRNNIEIAPDAASLPSLKQMVVG